MLDRIVEEAPRFFGYYNLLFLGQALAATVLLSAVGCAVGVAGGFVLAVVRRTGGRGLAPLRWLAVAYVEIFRRVPFLVTLLLIFFLFEALRLGLTTFQVALVSVCLIATAYIAEIVRGGFDAVHRTQWDAAAVLNFSYGQTLRWVVVPQAWRVILPPAFSFFVLFIKDTALASQVGVLELTYAGKVLNNKGFSAALVFGSILVLYFLVSWPLARAGVWMEKKLAPSRNR